MTFKGEGGGGGLYFAEFSGNTPAWHYLSESVSVESARSYGEEDAPLLGSGIKTKGHI